jgi:hypothetical protein
METNLQISHSSRQKNNSYKDEKKQEKIPSTMLEYCFFYIPQNLFSHNIFIAISCNSALSKKKSPNRLTCLGITFLILNIL